MPLDPNIILQAGRGVTPLLSPAEIEQQRAQREMQALQLQQARQGMADDQATREAYASGGDVGQALQQRGLYKPAMEHQKFQSEQQKSQTTAAKAAAEGMRNGANMVFANPTEANAIQTLTETAQLYKLPMQVVDSAKARIYSARNDPNQIRQIAQGWGADAEKVLGKFTTENLGGTLQTQRVNPITGQLDISSVQQKTASPDSLLNAQTSMGNNAATIANSRRTADMNDARARELAAIRSQELAQNKQMASDKSNLDRVDKKVTAFSTQLDKTNIPQFESLLGEIEAEISNYSQRGDIPGYGKTGSLPQFLLSDEGKTLRQKIAQLQNLTLKDRSGAAVTNQELQRLLNELGTGVLSTDAQLKTGLSQVRRNLDAVKQNVVAGVDDATLAEYQSRGGMPLKRGMQKPGSDASARPKQKVVNIGGKEYMAELAPEGTTGAGSYWVQQNGKWHKVGE